MVPIFQPSGETSLPIHHPVYRTFRFIKAKISVSAVFNIFSRVYEDTKLGINRIEIYMFLYDWIQFTREEFRTRRGGIEK